MLRRIFESFSNYIKKPELTSALKLDDIFIGAIKARNSVKMHDLVIIGAVDINKQDDLHMTPLMHACTKGYTSMAEFLVEQGAYLEKKNIIGNTALLIAASNGHIATAVALVELGADINAINNNAKTVEVLAKEAGFNMMQALRDAREEKKENMKELKEREEAKINSVIAESSKPGTKRQIRLKAPPKI